MYPDSDTTEMASLSKCVWRRTYCTMYSVHMYSARLLILADLVIVLVAGFVRPLHSQPLSPSRGLRCVPALASLPYLAALVLVVLVGFGVENSETSTVRMRRM